MAVSSCGPHSADVKTVGAGLPKSGPVTRRPCHPTGGDGDAVRRMASFMVGQIPQPLPCSAHSPTTPGALSKHRGHRRCSPAAQSCASRVPCSVAPPQPHSGSSERPAAAYPVKVWNFQNQSCLETTRDYATVACPSESPCLNWGQDICLSMFYSLDIYFLLPDH